MLKWLAVGALGFVVGVATVPHWVCDRLAERWYTGDRVLQESSARAVDAWIAADLSHGFSTGSDRFDGEWRFGTLVTGAVGFAQIALEHPETARRQRPRIERALDLALAPSGHTFDTVAWGSGGLDDLDSDRAHAAFLGYLNLALGLHRMLYPDSKYARVHDAISRALERRVERSPTLLLETYPGETYPVDNAAVIASIAVHARSTGQSPPPVVGRWVSEVRRRNVDRATGLLHQRVSLDGTPLDAARGSGTALAAYFLSYADMDLSRDLHRAVERELAVRVAGFEGIQENGRGDIDSGPLVFGFSIAATGFELAGCRIHGDRACHRRLTATLDLFGAPREHDGVTSHVSGGPLADALMLALRTAPRRSP